MIKYMSLIGIKARKASTYKVNSKKKNKVLSDYTKFLEKEKKLIIDQNLKDITYANKIGLSENLIDRLQLNQKKTR